MTASSRSVGRLVVLALGGGEGDRPAYGVVEVDLAAEDVVPVRGVGVLEVGEPHLGARCQRVDRHLALGGAGDLHPTVGEVGRGGRDAPLPRPHVGGLRKEVEGAGRGDLGPPVAAPGKELVAPRTEPALQVGEEGQCVRRQDLLAALDAAASHLDGAHSAHLAMRSIAVIHAGPMTSAATDPRPVGVVLAAGAGTRLRPLTELRPKALCPVGNRPLVDWALDRVAPHVSRTAVNVHHHREQLLAHLSGREVHVSVEEPVALGTAGALGRLRDWVAGAAVLLTNADSWSPAHPDPLGAAAGRLGRRAAAPALPPRPGARRLRGSPVRRVRAAALVVDPRPAAHAGRALRGLLAGSERGGPGRPGRRRPGAHRLRHARRLPGGQSERLRRRVGDRGGRRGGGRRAPIGSLARRAGYAR